MSAATASAAPAGKPNLLLIMSDQQRGDCMGIAGNPAIKTPNMDRLGREGAYFPHGYSCTPSCTPARAALLTGLAPWRNGMLGYDKIPERYPNEMPRMLGEAGYSTTAIGKCHYHPQRNGHGFDKMILDESGREQTPEFRSDYRSWFYSVAPTLDPDATGVGFNDYLGRPFALPEELHPTRWTGDTAVNFLSTYDDDKPFFLKVSFARPHSPYDAPPRCYDLYRQAPIPERNLGDWCERYVPRSWEADDIWHGDMGAEATRHSRMGYYGNITFIDEQIGRMLDVLDGRGLLENTLIVYFSDHGDMMGDHHLWRKGYAYEPSARVPFLVRWPENFVKAKRGQIREECVEIRDVLPTLLDAAGAPGGEDLDGDSLLRLVKGDTQGWREFIDLEHDICYDKTNHWTAVTDGKMKYIFHAFDGTESLFDLENDPGETINLAPQRAHHARLVFWRARLAGHLKERGEAWVKDGELQIRPESMRFSPAYPKPA
jgi:arylsulfatase A-like enzyme